MELTGFDCGDETRILDQTLPLQGVRGEGEIHVRIEGGKVP